MNDLVKAFKALSDETRMSVVSEIYKQKEMSCADLQKMFPLSQPTFSHHMRKLIEANILEVRKEGVSHHYSINMQHLQKCGINLGKIVSLT